MFSRSQNVYIFTILKRKHHETYRYMTYNGQIETPIVFFIKQNSEISYEYDCIFLIAYNQKSLYAGTFEREINYLA